MEINKFIDDREKNCKINSMTEWFHLSKSFFINISDIQSDGKKKRGNDKNHKTRFIKLFFHVVSNASQCLFFIFVLFCWKTFFLSFFRILPWSTGHIRNCQAVSLFHFNKLLSLKMREWSAIKIIMMQKKPEFYVKDIYAVEQEWTIGESAKEREWERKREEWNK